MIVDLSNNISFCIDFQIMMMEYEECLKDFDEFFIKNKKNSISSLIIGILFSAIGISLFVLGLSNVISINYFYLMFLFNILMSYMYFYISKDMFLKLDKFINSYGKLIKISHGNGVETWYAHCSSLYGTVGQQVNAGEVIAAVGSTGNSTGNHLHLEIRVNGKTLNPQKYLYK